MHNNKHRTENSDIKAQNEFSSTLWVFFLPPHPPIEREDSSRKEKGRKERRRELKSVFNEVDEYFTSTKESSKELSLLYRQVVSIMARLKT